MSADYLVKNKNKEICYLGDSKFKGKRRRRIVLVAEWLKCHTLEVRLRGLIPAETWLKFDLTLERDLDLEFAIVCKNENDCMTLLY